VNDQEVKNLFGKIPVRKLTLQEFLLGCNIVSQGYKRNSQPICNLWRAKYNTLLIKSRKTNRIAGVKKRKEKRM
jgi:hypothetical protein